MVRGYRYIFVAVVGLTLIGAAPNDGGKIESKQAATQETSQDDLKRIAAALEKLPQREAQDAGCDVGKDKRDSNLCAQWKAADSANQSANWAARTFWAGVAGLCIGGLTLLFAALAAHWAKQAAIHTADGASAAQDANNISRNTLSVQLRPWVNSQGIELFITQNTIINNAQVDRAVCFRLPWKNTGQSPAIKGRIVSHFALVELGEPVPSFDQTIQSSGTTIASGAIVMGVDLGFAGADMQRWLDRKIEIIIFGRVEYCDSIPPCVQRWSECTIRIQFNGWLSGAEHMQPNITARPDGPQNAMV